jgi:hypothetical protein
MHAESEIRCPSNGGRAGYFFSFWELGFRVENFPQKITNEENKLSFVIVLHCLRVKQHVFKTDKAHKINPEVVLVVTVLQD